MVCPKHVGNTVIYSHKFSICGTPLDNQLFGINFILDEVIPDIDVFGAPGGAEYSILLK